MALARRLATGRLTVDDEALVERAKVIRARRRQGWTYARIGDELGLARRVVTDFASRGIYGVILDWLEAAERGEPVAKAATVATKAEHRGVIQRLVPKALRRLELALEAGEVDGRLVESKTADHAMDTVLEAAGLLEPEGGAVRPVIHIAQLVVNQQLDAIRDDERRAIDVTPVAVGA